MILTKKIIFTVCFFSLASQVSLATPNRVAALGGETAMLMDDDTNIDFFPQHINKLNLLRLSAIETTTPDYAIVTGKAGDKWGLYGGTVEQNDFFNIYRSLNENSAIKVGFRAGRYSESVTTNNNEITPGDANGSEKNRYYTLAVNGVYGVNKADKEIALRGVFSYGPNAINTIIGSSLTRTAFGSYEASNTVAATTSNTSGTGNQFVLGGGASLRKPMKIAIFDKIFATGSAFYSSNSASLSTDAVNTQDSSSKFLFVTARLLMFTEKKIGEKSRIVYGLGGQALISRNSINDQVTSTDSSITTLSFTGPQIRLGIESDLKYGTVRFGIQRDLSVFSYTSNNFTVLAGANNDTNNASTFNIATAGTYSVSSGFGVEYNNLKIDVVLRRVFWVSGPQLVFDSSNGTIATAADVLYTF